MKYNYSHATTEEIDCDFIEACQEGNIDLVKFLLTSPEDIPQWADIHAQNDDALIIACLDGHYEIVEFLLMSSQLKEHIKANTQENDGFYWACQSKHFDICKLLLSSQLENSVELWQVQDKALQDAMAQQNAEVIDFLVNDLLVEKTDFIDVIISEKSLLPKKMIEHLKQSFAKRDLRDNLNKFLNVSESKINKIKL